MTEFVNGMPFENGLPIFSYSSLKMFHDSSHQWVNRVNRIAKDPNAGNYVKPDGSKGNYFTEGKVGHRIIQDHVSGKKLDPRIVWLTEKFPIVEKKDFDKDCEFKIKVKGYTINGFLDAQDPNNKRYGEIKLSSSTWSYGQYKKSVQRKIYALAYPQYKEGILITGPRFPDEWKIKEFAGEKYSELKVLPPCPLTDQDRKDAEKWIVEGIEIFESGDFTGGLNEDGRCIDRNCAYGPNCLFRQR